MTVNYMNRSFNCYDKKEKEGGKKEIFSVVKNVQRITKKYSVANRSSFTINHNID